MATALVWFTATDIAHVLPTITGALGGTMGTLQWTVNGYFLAGALIIAVIFTARQRDAAIALWIAM